MTTSSTSDIRAWAQSQGHPVGDRGRLPSELVAAYHAALKISTPADSKIPAAKAPAPVVTADEPEVKPAAATVAPVKASAVKPAAAKATAVKAAPVKAAAVKAAPTKPAAVKAAAVKPAAEPAAAARPVPARPVPARSISARPISARPVSTRTAAAPKSAGTKAAGTKSAATRVAATTRPAPVKPVVAITSATESKAAPAKPQFMPSAPAGNAPLSAAAQAAEALARQLGAIEANLADLMQRVALLEAAKPARRLGLRRS